MNRSIARRSIFIFPDTFDIYMSIKTFATDQYQFIINNGIYVNPVQITPERLITHNILLTAKSARVSIKRILGSLRVFFFFRAAAEHYQCGNGKQRKKFFHICFVLLKKKVLSCLRHNSFYFDIEFNFQFFAADSAILVPHTDPFEVLAIA